MNKDTLKGSAQRARGSVKTAAAKATGDKKLRAKGMADRAVGEARRSVGKAKEAVHKATR